MTRLFYRFHCLIILYLSVLALSRLSQVDFKLQNSLALDSAWMLSVPVLSILLACAGFWIDKFWQRLGLFLSFTLTQFVLFAALGKIHHSVHVWMFASLFLCLIKPAAPLTDRMNLGCLRLIQTTLLAHYFIAGVWKVRSLMNSPSADAFIHQVWDHFAYAIAEGNGPGPLILGLLTHPIGKPIIEYGFLSVIVFQLSAVIPIALNRHWKLWGILSLTFHIFTGFFLGIWFQNTLLASLFFLIFVEAFREAHPSSK